MLTAQAKNIHWNTPALIQAEAMREGLNQVTPFLQWDVRKEKWDGMQWQQGRLPPSEDTSANRHSSYAASNQAT